MITIIKNPIEPNSFYTLKSVAAQLEMDVKSVRFLIKEGKLKSVCPNGKTMYVLGADLIYFFFRNNENRHKTRQEILEEYYLPLYRTLRWDYQIQRDYQSFEASEKANDVFNQNNDERHRLELEAQKWIHPIDTDRSESKEDYNDGYEKVKVPF